jgi:rare lipoprotein A
MKTLFITLFGEILGMIALNQVQAQKITASLADDLSKTTVAKETKATISFNKKVKLTNTENGKTVVVRINDRMKSVKNDKVANISKSAIDQLGMKPGKSKVKVQELEADDQVGHFWATADVSASTTPTVTSSFKKIVKEKEVEIETTKMDGFDINHVYDLNGKIQELSGYGLQLAAFGQLKAAKDFATKLAKNGEAEIEKVFIQVSKSAEKPMVYRVIYGLFDDATDAKNTQKKMETFGHNALVKGF